MTDLTPGSRWLLPVEFMHQTGHTATTTDGAGWFFGGGRTVFVRDLTTLIPADRITELEGEVARLDKLYEDARRAHADEIISVMYLREELRKMKCP